jgi:hypothetical protein
MKINVNFTLNIDVDKYAKENKEQVEKFLNATKEKHFETMLKMLNETFVTDEFTTVDINGLEVER